MAHMIVTGATGTAGSAILAECLASPVVAKVSVLSRRPVKQAENNPKASVILHSDYGSYPPTVLEQLRGATGCIWAQGRSSLGMNEAEYTTLTHDWPLAAAKAFADLPGDQGTMKFVYISGEGADPDEKARAMFGRIKGRAEKDLVTAAAATANETTTPALAVYNLRPGVIDPMGKRSADQPFSIARHVPVAIVGSAIKVLYPSMHTPATKLAQVALKLATGDAAPVPSGKGVYAGGWTLDNSVIRKLAGL